MKKLLLLIVVLPTIASAAWWNPASWFQSNELKVGAPILSFQPSLIPITDSLFDLGTTTKAWRQGWFDELCLTADSCKTAWPTGGGGSGGGAHSTSTAFGATDYIFPNGSTNIYALGYDGTGVATSSNEAEYVADPTAKLASYLNGMKLGIGTTTPYAPLSVVGEILGSYFTATTTATSTLAGGLQTNLLRVTSATASSTFSNGINLTAGCFSINGTCVGGGGTGASTTLLADTNTWSGGNIFANTTTTNATSTSQAITNTSSALLQVDANGSVGEYAGTSCTNQFVRSLSALGVATCATVGASDVSLANLTATDSTLTFSGTYNGATARTIGLNLGNANTWTVNQTFNYSSSTAYSSFRTASTTNLIVNGENFSDLTGTGLAISGGALVTSNIPNASLQNSTISGVALGSNLNALTNDTTLVGTSYNGSSAISDWGIDLSNPNTWTGLQQFQGKASSTLLSVYNGLYVGTTGTTTILGTATSTFGAGVEATYLNITGTSATSTFARGINLAGGCFAINGTCIGGSGSSASTTLLADSNTFSGLNAFTNSGTTSFTGGIATERIDTSATSTLAGLRIDSGGLQISTLNCSGLTNGGTLTTDASGNVTCADDDGGAGGSANSKWGTSTDTTSIFPNTATKVGIGTSTPAYNLTLSSSSASQLGFTDGSLTSNHFTARNAGGIFYISTSSPSTYATSSPLLTINGTTGDVSFGSGTTGISLNPIGSSYFTYSLGIGTTTPYAKLSVVGETVSAYFTATTSSISTFPSLTSTNATTTGTFALPVGASPTVSVAGQCAIDTTSGQLKCHTGSAVQVFRAQVDQSFVYATSSWTGTTTVPLGPAAVAETWDSIACFTDTGTVQVSLNDGTNRMNFLNASTTVNKNVLSTNNTFTALEKRYADLGTPASSPKQVSCTVTKSITAD